MASYHLVPTAHEVSPEADHDDDYSDNAKLLGPGEPKLPVPWITRPWAHPALLVGSHIFVLVLGGVLGSLLIMNASPSNTFATCGDVVSRDCSCFSSSCSWCFSFSRHQSLTWLKYVAPFLRDVGLKWSTQEFDGSVFHLNPYKNDPSDEVDAAWIRLGTRCTFLFVWKTSPPPGSVFKLGMASRC